MKQHSPANDFLSFWLGSTFVWVLLLGVAAPVYHAMAQDTIRPRTSIPVKIGLGIHEGDGEIGVGFLYSVGWQKSMGRKHKIRINPQLTMGEFHGGFLTDVREQYYRISLYEFNVHYDLVRIGAFSLVTSAGVFGEYSRGLFAAFSTMDGHYIPEAYFHHFYVGGRVSMTLRLTPKRSRWAFEWRPLSIYLGNRYLWGYAMMFGMDIPLGCR